MLKVLELYRVQHSMIRKRKKAFSSTSSTSSFGRAIVDFTSDMCERKCCRIRHNLYQSSFRLFSSLRRTVVAKASTSVYLLPEFSRFPTVRRHCLYGVEATIGASLPQPALPRELDNVE